MCKAGNHRTNKLLSKIGIKILKNIYIYDNVHEIRKLRFSTFIIIIIVIFCLQSNSRTKTDQTHPETSQKLKIRKFPSNFSSLVSSPPKSQSVLSPFWGREIISSRIEIIFDGVVSGPFLSTNHYS